MKQALSPPPGPWRIAVVSHYCEMMAQHCLTGLCRRADHAADVTLQIHNAIAPDFRREVLHPLQQWRPHGLIVRMVDWSRLQRLRRQFPALPCVATMWAPPDLVNTYVAASTSELLAVARDYFQKCGLAHVALFCMAEEVAVAKLTAKFRDAVPGGPEVICPRRVANARTAAEKNILARIMTRGLRGLPKPVGIVTLETEAAPFLLEWCQRLKLRIPQDVQIIGVDEEDRCLAAEPHLTSLNLPNERIGEVALETMLRHLRDEQPLPPPPVLVSGGRVIPRGSTSALAVGSSAIAGVLEKMRAHATQGIRAARVAKLAKVGRTTFFKEFAAATGETPARHLRHLRLQEACRLLRETKATMKDIASACGFKDRVAFVHFFRRQTGQTPTSYRQRLRPQPLFTGM